MNNSKIQDILDILDFLELSEARKRLIELYKSPEFSSYHPLQLLREILTVQYINDKNSSTIREFITTVISGYMHHETKIGYNGFRQ